MTHDRYCDDAIVVEELRDALSGLTVRERPSLAEIVDRGRRQQRRRRGRLAGVGLAAVAAGGVLAFGLAGVHNGAPISTTSKPNSRGTVRTAAFTLVSYADGKAKLTLTNSQVFDPPALRRALARDGIAALVRRDVYCYSTPAPPDPNALGVLSIRPHLLTPNGFAPAKALLKMFRPHEPRPSLKALINHTVTVIDPAKMPAGTELAFDYAPNEHLLAVDLVYVKSHVCRSGQAPAH
jgi:hypothetical protein